MNDYLQQIEELLEAKMKRRERISPVIFVSTHVLAELHKHFLRYTRFEPGSSSNGVPAGNITFNTSMGVFTIMVNKEYEPERITNDGRSLDDILVEDILLGSGEIT